MKNISFYLSILWICCALLILPEIVFANEKYEKPDKITNWLFQPSFTSSDAGWDNGILPWIMAVENATEGTVQITLEPAGTITTGAGAFHATIVGVTDVYAGWASLYGDEMPEGMLAFGLPMGADNYRDSWAAMFGDPKYRIGRIVEKAANNRNLEWVGWTSQGPNAMFTTFPVHKIEDLAERKMRAGGPQALFHAAMAGTPVGTGVEDIYSAITLGSVDGTYWDIGGLDDMRFQEIIKYAILPSWCPSQSLEIYVNLDRWKALNQWQRDRIKSVFMPTYFETSRLHTAGVEEALEIFEQAGGEVITLSPEEVTKMRNKTIKEVWPQIAAKSDATAKGVQLWKEFLKDIDDMPRR